MAVVVLPDAQEDLLSLQAYMLDKWSESDWLKAEDEIFEKLVLVDKGLLTGAPVPELASVGVPVRDARLRTSLSLIGPAHGR